MNIKTFSIAVLLACSAAVSESESKFSIYARLELNAAYEDNLTGSLWDRYARNTRNIRADTDGGEIDVV